jgi:hypothetical protein
MAATREQLISDWRQELTAAEQSAAASPRLAWLARMKVRLYRFLLACYGGSDWQPPSAIETDSQVDSSSQAVFDSAQAAELAGKPAKSGVEIRCVLTAVAKAQDDPHAPGPLAGGLDHDSWVVVAAASSKLKLGQSLRLLQAAGLHPRACYRGDDRMIEVPACERHEAFEVIAQNRHRVQLPPETPRTQPPPLLMRLGAAAVVSAWISFMLAWMLVASIHAYAGPRPGNGSLGGYLFSPDILALWAGLFLIVLQLSLLLLLGRRPSAKVAKVNKAK